MDGNFQHRRYNHVKEDPKILSSDDDFNWITESEVNAAKDHVEQCRRDGNAVNSQRSKTVPERILDECEKSFKASQEKMHEPGDAMYDSKGVMALVCRHDIPLFILDIKSLGEPRYYAIALLRKLASHLPETATIGVMYDIAEQLHRSIAKVTLFAINPRRR